MRVLLRQILQYKVAEIAKNSKCLIVNRMSLPSQEMLSLWTLAIAGVLGLNFLEESFIFITFAELQGLFSYYSWSRK
jgi:hypothetical protein